ncbi:MAG: AMP-binding protein [Deltaproteobacteria bacterium]|nr:AMP-binding protein [Deltaproteobacteria bacterium]
MTFDLLPAMDDYEACRRDVRLEIPDDFNFAWDVVGQHARQRGDDVAFIAVPTDGPPRPVTFGAFDDAAARVARGLLRLGLNPGDRVLSMIPRIPAFYEAMIGAMKVGVVSMPGTNLLTSNDIAYRLRASGAKAVIVTAEHADKVDAIRAQCPSLELSILIGADRPGWTRFETLLATAEPLERSEAPVTRATDTMLVYFTSGTTAHPKMVARDFAYGLAHALTGKYWMALRPGDVHWTLTDTGWAKAAWGLVFPPWLMGATTVLFEGGGKFDVPTHLSLIETLGVTSFCAPPTVYRLFAQHDLGGFDASRLRRSLSAGEPLNPEVIRVWKDATGHAPADGYGQTETVNLVANFPGVSLRPGSMGKPVPGLDVRVVDAQGREVGPNEVGNIAVRLPTVDGRTANPDPKAAEPWPLGLFRGYESEDGDRSAYFHHGHYFTGDTATRDEDGYIWFVGRADDVISSAAYRISPFEVESALQEHPAVAEAAVVAKPDALRGHIVVAFIVLAAGHGASDALASEIQQHVKTTTAPYKYPREIYFREQLPKTISGKIRRVQLRAQAQAMVKP